MSKITLANLANILDNSTATTINANSAIIQTAMDNTLSRDGTAPNPMLSNLDMNSFHILNLTTPATADEPLRLRDLNSFIGGGTVTNIPAGGTTGQLLGKVNATDYNVAWIPVTGTGNVVYSTSPTLVTPALGTPSAIVLTNGTGLPVSTGISGLAAGISAFLATPTSSNLATAVTDETGSGALVFATSPVLVTPALGTPSALIGTNITGTAAGLTAGNVTTNANLTGDVTSVGNATTLATTQSAVHTWSAIQTLSNATASTSTATGAIVVTGGAGVGGDIFGGGKISATAASGFYLGANQLAVTSTNYNVFRSSDGATCLSIGNNSDPTLYYDRATHKLRSSDNSTVFVTINSSGVSSTNNIVSTSPTAGVGYATGAGGTVPQATSRTTGVTLNKVSGAITLFSQINTAVSQATAQSFTVTNSAVAATDTIVVNQKSGTDKYEIFVTNVAAGSFQITNYAVAGTTNEAPVFNFNVIKGVAS